MQNGWEDCVDRTEPAGRGLVAPTANSGLWMGLALFDCSTTCTDDFSKLLEGVGDFAFFDSVGVASDDFFAAIFLLTPGSNFPINQRYFFQNVLGYCLGYCL